MSLSAGEFAHCFYYGLVGDGDVWSHGGFVSVSCNLADNCGRYAEFEGNAYEGTSGTVGSKELPFWVNFIISYVVFIIAVLYRSIETAYLPKDCYFDTERVDFIKNFDSIDLLAVPGSGKTTALIAKLFLHIKATTIRGWDRHPCFIPY